MAESHDARLVELVGELGGDDVRFLFRDLVEKALQELIDAELTEAIGAGPYERTETRTNRRIDKITKDELRREAELAALGTDEVQHRQAVLVIV